MVLKCRKSQRLKLMLRRKSCKERKASPSLQMNKTNLSSSSVWLKRSSRCSDQRPLQSLQKKNTFSVKSLQRNSLRKQRKNLSTVKHVSSDQSCQWPKKTKNNWSISNGSTNLPSARSATLPAMSFAWACLNIIPSKQ